MAPSTPPTTAISAFRILMVTKTSRQGGARTAVGSGCRAADRPAPRPLRSLRPARFDVVERGLGVLLTADPRGHLAPEGTGPDLTGHLVRAVEDELRGGVGDVRDGPDRLVGVHAGVEVGPRGDPAAGRPVAVRPEVGRGQELDQLL